MPQRMSLPDGERVTIYFGHIQGANLYCKGQQHKAQNKKKWASLGTVLNEITNAEQEQYEK